MRAVGAVRAVWGCGGGKCERVGGMGGVGSEGRGLGMD